MPEDTRLTLRQVDQLRTDIANLECGQEMLMHQIARMPTQGDLTKMALGVIFCPQSSRP
jgi:hypothetical protein